jgi:endonuclease G, mitochondrial
MKKWLMYTCLAAVLLFSSGCLTGIQPAGGSLETNDNLKYGIPGEKGKILVRAGYVLLYDSDKKDPMWVSYHLTKERLSGPAKRTNEFAPDPDLSAGEGSQLSDFRNSGYDRGHMCPAADNYFSVTAMRECFYLSNMTPQLHALNAGLWEKLEEKERSFARSRGECWIICGPVFKGENRTIGPDRVFIPSAFYKIIVYETAGGTKAVGFEMPQKKPVKGLGAYVVRIKEIESDTGLDFLSKLPSPEHQKLEAELPVTAEFLN